jgi:hypothetical protein
MTLASLGTDYLTRTIFLMPPLNTHQPPSSVLRRVIELPIRDPIGSGNKFTSMTGAARPASPGAAVVNFSRLGNPAPFSGGLAHPRRAPGQIEVSALFSNAWKKEIYDAWVDLDLLPAFMRGLEDGSEAERFELPWYLKLDDGEVRWEARTTECVPGDRIAWEGGDHAACRNNGCVTFEPEGRAVTRVSISLQFDVSGAPEITDRVLKSVESQLQDTLALLHIFLAPHALPPALACL